ncbi:MAG: cytochrome c, partial [Novosphingobium sp.]
VDRRRSSSELKIMSKRADEQLHATRRSAATTVPAQRRQPARRRDKGSGMRGFWRLLPVSIAGCLLASSPATPRAKAPATVETHEAMIDGINPAAITIWDVVASAKSETEVLDPSVMDRAAWSKLQRAARSLELHSNRMAHASRLRVGNHTAEQVGFANKAEIQARIDAAPKWFRAISQTMAVQAGELSRAAAARNPRATRDLVERMSDQCQSCHTRFWAKPAS